MCCKRFSFQHSQYSKIFFCSIFSPLSWPASRSAFIRLPFRGSPYKSVLCPLHTCSGLTSAHFNLWLLSVATVLVYRVYRIEQIIYVLCLTVVRNRLSHFSLAQAFFARFSFHKSIIGFHPTW